MKVCIDDAMCTIQLQCCLDLQAPYEPPNFSGKIKRFGAPYYKPDYRLYIEGGNNRCKVWDSKGLPTLADLVNIVLASFSIYYTN